MIKVKYFPEQTFIIDQGKLISDNLGLNKIFKSMNQEVFVWQGEPDFVLARRLMQLIGGGKIVVKIAEQSDPEIVY